MENAKNTCRPHCSNNTMVLKTEARKIRWELTKWFDGSHLQNGSCWQTRDAIKVSGHRVKTHEEHAMSDPLRRLALKWAYVTLISRPLWGFLFQNFSVSELPQCLSNSESQRFIVSESQFLRVPVSQSLSISEYVWEYQSSEPQSLSISVSQYFWTFWTKKIAWYHY